MFILLHHDARSSKRKKKKTPLVKVPPAISTVCDHTKICQINTQNSEMFLVDSTFEQ